ncbi:MAG TPA: SpoIIE family protein phosphatase [Solirubrobacteraceae bacterium]|nr:SpoIIE family protein phosphatase [Solirubrobacteraceae bacterium]
MADRVREDLRRVDWERTPLGAPTTWPNSLRTMVRVMLASRFSMWMAWGPELTFFCNDAYRRDTLGAKYPWALGRPAREVWAEIWPEIGPRVEHVLRTGEATWDEMLRLFVERSGYEEESYHTFSYSPLYDDDGGIVGLLCVVAEETERVIGERRITTLRDLNSVSTAATDEQAFLEDSAAQMARNPHSLPFVCIYTYEPDGRARLQATSGVAAGEPVAPEVIEPEDEAPAWPARELARGGQSWIVIDDLPGRFASVPLGGWPQPPTRAVAVPLPGATDGRPVGFMVAGVNRYRPADDVYHGFIGTIAQRLGAGVTNARSYAAERERAEQLAELDRAKTAFFSNVSHEFRTPLTLMLGPLEDALQSESELEIEQVELVHRSGLRLLKLVNTLLDFSKLEAGRLRAQFVPVDAAALTAELAGMFREACERAGLALEVEIEPSPAGVYLDPDLWERVILNLLSNAFKVTVHGSIRVRLFAAADELVLAVADTGPGIPAAEQERIFERFHRVRELQARSHEGTGIGLALVREIVELHGGEIDLHSVVGEGSEFVIRVPLGRAHLPAEHVTDVPAVTAAGVAELFVQEALSWLPDERGAAPPMGGASEVRGGARVLIADDNPDLRRYLTRLLSPHWSVETAADGARALEQIRRRPPDLLVTDVMMPRLDGFGLLRELRGMPETQDLPVIMLSARAGEESSIEGLDAGADDYLPKPFSGRELVARIRAHLELSLARNLASEALRAERALLEQTLQQLPVGVLLAEAPADRVILANAQLGVIFGRPGLRPEEVRPLIYERMHLADRRTLVGQPGLLTRAMVEGTVYDDLELSYLREDGHWRTLLANGAPVLDAGGEVIASVIVLEDISDRTVNEQLIAGQRDVMSMIARGEPLATMLSKLTAVLEAISQPGARASILLVSDDGKRLGRGIAPSLPASFTEAIEGIPIAEGVGCCGTAAHRREPVVAHDISTDPLWEDLRDLAAEHGLRSCWSTPIFATGGRLVGTFSVYHDAPSTPTEKAREVVGLLAQTAAVAIERSRDVTLRERQLSELQTSLLPPVLPTVPGLEAAAAFHSGDRSLEVGGDFYDLFALDDGAWGLIVGDVCGHGAQAAAVTALARHSAWNHARMHEDPSQVLCHVSEALLVRGYERFCTAVYGRIERDGPRTRLCLASGGHPPPLLRRADGTIELLREHGPLLGVMEGPSFPVVNVTLQPGDALLLYTDGLIERNAMVLSEEALLRVAGDLRGETAAELLHELEVATLGPEPRRPRDDVALLIVKQPRA